jgi:hypothetical protein
MTAALAHHVLRGTHRTFAPLIADLDPGSPTIAVGPPCQHEYATYSLGDRP